MGKSNLPKATKIDLKAILSPYKGKEEELIPILQAVQNKLGYLSNESLLKVAEFTGVPESKVYGVATFYAQFKFVPMGKNHISVCMGTACHVRGASNILEDLKHKLGIKEGECTKDRKYSLETVACIGCCGLSPCIMVNKKVEAKMTPEKVTHLLSEGEKNNGV